VVHDRGRARLGEVRKRLDNVLGEQVEFGEEGA
jgi:hypothetical protein